MVCYFSVCEQSFTVLDYWTHPRSLWLVFVIWHENQNIPLEKVCSHVFNTACLCSQFSLDKHDVYVTCMHKRLWHSYTQLPFGAFSFFNYYDEMWEYMKIFIFKEKIETLLYYRFVMKIFDRLYGRV